MQAKNAHIQGIMAEYGLRIADIRIALKCTDFVESLPWCGTRVDWRAVAKAEIRQCDSMNAEEFIAWIKSMTIAPYQHGIVFCGLNDPCLVGRMDILLRNIDHIFSRVAGSGFIFGAIERSWGFEAKCDDLLEYYDGRTVAAIRS